MTTPNLFVVGSPRSGTTSIANWLGQHPNVWMSHPKEPAFYAFDLRMLDRIGDRERYMSLFDPGRDHRFRGEATPWYLYSTASAEAIGNESPEAHVVILLRDPVDLIASLHNHHRYVGLESEPDLERAVTVARPPSTEDFRRSLDYLSVARVGEQVARFADLFPKSQMHFLRFEELARDSASMYFTVLGALGLDTIELDAYPALNPARRHRSTSLQVALRRITGAGSASGWRRRLWFGALQLNTVAAKPSVSRSLRDQLIDVLKPDIKLLEDISGEDLSSWRSQ